MSDFLTIAQAIAQLVFMFAAGLAAWSLVDMRNMLAASERREAERRAKFEKERR